MKRKIGGRSLSLYKDLIIGIIVLVLAVTGISIGISVSESSRKSENLKIAENGVRRAALECYAAEGRYPDNVEYLVENYHLYIDNDRYVIHYNPISSNIMPDIRVLPK